jgi:hypothetical protein
MPRRETIWAALGLVLAVALAAALSAGGDGFGSLLVARLEAAETCEFQTFATNVVEGRFQWLECGDYCHLGITIDNGDERRYLVAGEAQDFTVRPGARIRVTADVVRFHLEEGGYCERTEVATSLEPLDADDPRLPESCPDRTYETYVVEGEFERLECVDYCHLSLTVNGNERRYVVPGGGGVAPKPGAKIRVVASLRQY